MFFSSPSGDENREITEITGRLGFKTILAKVEMRTKQRKTQT